MSSVFVILLLAVPCLCLPQAGHNLSALIDEVFSGMDQDSTKGNLENAVKTLNEDCTCVPYYLCQNNQIITDGVGLIDIRLKEGPCENYLDVCCGEEPLKNDDRITPPPSTREGCGQHNPDGIGFRITGDQDGESQYGEFPWMVAILKEEVMESETLNVFQCGGSLIHPEVVMTAAHCVPKNNRYKIRAGEWDTQTNNELFPYQDVSVKEIVIHNKYYPGGLYNDVALLFLEKPVTLAENVDVICLPEQGAVFDYTRCYASGWGKDQFGKEGQYQVIMKKVELPIESHESCQNSLRLTRLGPFFKLHPSFVCAGGEQGKDTCRGDGGSPLSCPVAAGGRFAQVGIVSWGIGCGEQGTPGVYANVASFRHWIDQQLQSRNLDASVYQV